MKICCECGGAIIGEPAAFKVGGKFICKVCYAAPKQYNSAFGEMLTEANMLKLKSYYLKKKLMKSHLIPFPNSKPGKFVPVALSCNVRVNIEVFDQGTARGYKLNLITGRYYK